MRRNHRGGVPARFVTGTKLLRAAPCAAREPGDGTAEKVSGREPPRIPGGGSTPPRPRGSLTPAVLRAGGLVVEITDGDAYFYRGHLFYDLVKTTVIRMAFALSQELKEHDITALAVTPGFLRSEGMLDRFGVTEANWRDAAQKVPSFLASETPLFVGRCIAALAADPNVRIKKGRVFASWDLADEYDVTDADGTRPHFVGWLRKNQPHVAALWKKYQMPD